MYLQLQLSPQSGHIAPLILDSRKPGHEKELSQIELAAGTGPEQAQPTRNKITQRERSEVMKQGLRRQAATADYIVHAVKK
ncbi:MAG: hypothetical protein WD272_00640 [Balneolales bacterium]